MKKLTCLLLAVSALALAGCGMRGNLERPPPMWGDPAQEPVSEPDADGEE
tara:strand:+ start:2958 stop:3107 length:150 start_codon:yes stop_codon:yes gene_type:complete